MASVIDKYELFIKLSETTEDLEIKFNNSNVGGKRI